MAQQADHPDPSALGMAADGFVELALWFTGLVGDQVRTVARAVDARELDVDTLVGATARAATLPWLGWSAFVNEVFDAATVLNEPPPRDRTITSPKFLDKTGVARRELSVGDEPFVNGFGESLRTTGIRVTPTELTDSTTPFHLVAKEVPPECVGVYRGTVRVRPVGDGDDQQPGGASPAELVGTGWLVDVWLVVS